MQETQKLPPYLKFIVIHFGLILVVVTIYYLQDILLPFAFALLFAVLLNPVASRLERRLPRVLAVTLTVLLALLVLSGIVYFLSSQISMFSDTFPVFKTRFTEEFGRFQVWVTETFHISPTKQGAWLNSGLENLLNNGSKYLGTTLSIVTGVIVVLTLIPVYIFLFLYYRVMLFNFILAISKKGNQQHVQNIMSEIKQVIQNYIVGLLIEGAIVATLNSIGLLALGIQYAVLMGVIGAILNVIPYIGGIIAISLPVLIALVTKSIGHALGVIIVYIVIQFIDNHFLVPRIVASRVKLNAMTSIVGVIAGGALCGVPGMFLSIPFIAIVKIVFDHVNSLKPWGAVLGEQD